ncbi:hypothetical protein GCM10009347_37220 [Shewanella algicola]|uniref:TIGR02922 family protein n=1 Tax=Shewanella algicola TaxID=640633 RepID=A0A9X2CFH7_9GAMM|nr:DUF2375 family protein [Shewanella algicola]MCL1107426.1 TIGR02922 family protein [Shewanella algicola]GGP68411.1 hypothetical protein GCM10009347_37220 [Shewanella algicola]
MKDLPVITILYYDQNEVLDLKCEVLHGCEAGSGGRVIIPESVKENKIIIAVLDGQVKVLNTLGSRVENSGDISKVA